MITRFQRRGQKLALLVLAAIPCLPGCGGDTGVHVVLTGRAVLPADTFLAGPPVGAELDGEVNGRTPPFPSPPVQGISSLVHLGGLSWAALQDNGFGSAANSADYLQDTIANYLNLSRIEEGELKLSPKLFSGAMSGSTATAAS